MELAASLGQIQVRFVVGKGGVGKTTVTAALALAAARQGLGVEVVDLDGRPEIAACFDSDAPLTYAPRELYADASGGYVRARRISADEALVEWLTEHGFGRLVPRMLASGALEIIATAVPGIREVLVLGKLKALARDTADVVLVDAPATGHSLSLLAAPSALVHAARGGPIRKQAEEVDALLRDGSRCSVLLVTLADDLPVTEAVETAYDLEDRAGVALGVVIVNQFDEPPLGLRHPLSMAERAPLSGPLVAQLDRARAFTLARADEQAHQRTRLATELPLPQVCVPTAHHDRLDFAALSGVADALARASWP